MYSRLIDNELYTFGVSGKLIRNALVMYDRQTESLWAQILGKAVEGPLAGTELSYVPAVHTTWADWRAQHPDTLALRKGFRGNRDSYTGYFQSGQAGILGERNPDERLYTKEFVIGVARGDEAVAFPFRALNETPVVNSEVGGEPIVVVFDPGSASARVFRREVSGRTLTLDSGGEKTLMDEETGSVWSVVDGKAQSGSLVGEELLQVKSTAAFWFAWSDWYPQTEVFGELAVPQGE